jgi:hypothetical protein
MSRLCAVDERASGGSEQPIPSYLAVQIDEVAVDQQSIRQLLDVIIEKAKKAGAERLGFRGVVLANPQAESEIVTLRLSKVPLGTALGYLAHFSNCVLVEGSGFCVLYPVVLPHPELVSAVFEPSERARKEIGIASAKNATELRAALGAYGVATTEASSVVYNPTANVLYAQLPAREMELLRAVLTLIDRGVAVTPRAGVGGK